MLVNVVGVSCMARHGALVAEDVVPVVTIFTTGTEGGDIVLGYVDPETAVSGEMLLA